MDNLDTTQNELNTKLQQLEQAHVALQQLYNNTAAIQRQTEEKLIRLETDFKRAQQITHIGSWHLDVATNEVVWSDELYKMYGFDSALPPPPYTEHQKLFTPESWELLSSSLAHTAETGIPYELELKTVTRDGSNGWMWVRGETVADNEGKTIGLWGVAQDITQRKKLEDALSESNERFKSIFNNLQDAFFQADLNGNFTLVSPSALRMYNLQSFNEIIGMPTANLYANVSVRETLIKELSSKGYVRDFIGMGKRKDGSTFWLSMNVQFTYQNGSITGTEGVVRDISERMQMEEKLRQSEDKNKAITQNTPDHIIMQDKDLKYTLVVNPQLGLTEQDILGKTDHDFLSKKDADKLVAIKSRVLETGEPFHLDTSLISPLGKEEFFEGDYIPTFDAHDEANGLIGYFRNVTERKRAEEALCTSQALLYGLFDNIPSGAAIYQVNNQGEKGSDYIIKYFNKASLKIENLNLSQVIDKSLYDLRPNIDQYGLISIFKKVWETGKPAFFPSKIYEDNKYCNYYENTVFKLPTGEIVAIYSDVTERVQAEEKIKESENRYYNLLCNLETGIIVHAPDTSIVMNNDRASELFGLTNDQMKGKTAIDPAWKFIHEDNTPLTLDEYPVNEIAKSKHPIKNQILGIYNQSKNDTIWLSVNGFPSLDSKGEITEIVISFIDITERISTKKAMHDSEEKFRLSFMTGLDGFYIATLEDGKMIDVNHEMTTIFGYTREEYIGKTSLELNLYYNPAERAAMVAELKANGSVKDLELKGRKKDGTLIIISISVSTANIGSQPHIIGVIRDITEHKQAEKKLEDQRHIFEQILEQSLAGYWDWDIPSGEEYMSTTFKKMFGYEDHEIENRAESWQKLIFAEDLPSMYEKFNLHNESKGKIPFYNEVRYKHKNGSTIWVICTGNVIERDPDGNAKRMIGCHIDITERKQAEEARRKSESLKEQMLKNIGDVIVIIDKDGINRYKSPNIEQLFGWKPEDVVGHSIWDNVHPADLEAGMNFIGSLMVAPNTTGTTEIRYKKKDGTYCWIEITMVNLLHDIDVQGFLGNYHDITERKQAEEALQESKDYLDKIINSVASPIFVKDDTHKFCLVNEALCSMLNLPKEKILGTSGYEYLPKDQMEVFISKDKEVLNTGRESISEESLTDGQGITRTVITIKTLYVDPNGRNFLVGVINDITELRNATNEVKQLNSSLEQRVQERTFELEQANKELESFSYTISHDLQSPLRHISGFADMLASDYKESLAEEAQHFLNTIIKNAKLMARLIDDLLEFSRTNRKELLKTDLDMNKVVEAARLQVIRPADEARIDWHVSALPLVKGDYSLLLLVWINLIGNAFKYSKNKEKSIIKIDFQETEKENVFSISDNGIGFDMQYAQKLFGVFQRMHSSKGFDGTGIGLANVRNIITRHGGKTWAEAEPDKGATFYISLPRT